MNKSNYIKKSACILILLFIYACSNNKPQADDSNNAVSLPDTVRESKNSNLTGMYINTEYMSCVEKNAFTVNCCRTDIIKGITIKNDTFYLYPLAYDEGVFLIKGDSVVNNARATKLIGKFKSIGPDELEFSLSKEMKAEWHWEKVNQTFRRISKQAYRYPVDYYVNQKQIAGIYQLKGTGQLITLEPSGQIKDSLNYGEGIVYNEFEIEIDFMDIGNDPFEYNLIYLKGSNDISGGRSFCYEKRRDTLDIFEKVSRGDSKMERTRSKQDTSVFVLIRKR